MKQRTTPPPDTHQRARVAIDRLAQDWSEDRARLTAARAWLAQRGAGLPEVWRRELSEALGVDTDKGDM